MDQRRPKPQHGEACSVEGCSGVWDGTSPDAWAARAKCREDAGDALRIELDIIEKRIHAATTSDGADAANSRVPRL